MNDPIPPHDVDLEQKFLGALQFEGADMVRMALDLPVEALYVPAHRRLYASMRKAWKEHGEIDDVFLPEEMRRMALDFMERAEKFRIGGYFHELRKLAARRKAIYDGHEQIKAGIEGDVEIPPPYRTTGLEEMQAEIAGEIEGTRFAVPFAGFPCLSRCKALLPGSVTVLCGSPGASKSMLTVQWLWNWFSSGIPCSGLELEKGVAFHLRRVVAQACDASWLTDDVAINNRPSDVRALMAGISEKLQAFEKAMVLQSPNPEDKVTVDFVLQWVIQQAEMKRRAIVVDPYTIADTSARRWEDDQRFMREAGQAMTEFGSSLIVVLHPKDPAPGAKLTPALSNIRCGKALREFADTALWLEAHEMDCGTVALHDGLRASGQEYNRTLHVLKARLGPGQRDRLALKFDGETLRHSDVGRILDVEE